MEATTKKRLIADADRAKPTAARTVLFLSHANPEDNTFAKWLAAQLAIAGYEVWCDLTELLGGETFWNDIPEAIDRYTFRFLFASTLESNRKAGTLCELDLALAAEKQHKVRDFVIPLKVDDFPFASTQNSIRGRTFVRFDENWTDGLAGLLDLLQREGTSKSARSGADAVSAWYARTVDEKRRVVVSNEKCFSNWFSARLPERLHFHRTAASPEQLALAATALRVPHRIHGQSIAAFADSAETQEILQDTVAIRATSSVGTSAFIEEGSKEPEIALFDARNIVSDLVSQAFNQELERMSLRSHLLASGLRAWFFRNGQLERNRAYFTPHGGKQTYRQLVGRKSKRTVEGLKVPDGFWHYAISTSPQLAPFPRIVLRYHVVFTDDGETPWENAERMHRARRRVCKNWWNRDWRDRLFAMCAALGTNDGLLILPAGRAGTVDVSMTPETFTSPWTYYEDHERGVDESAEIELIEEHQGEDDDADREASFEPEGDDDAADD